LLPLVYYCEYHQIPLGPGHKFPAAKYGMVHSLVAADGMFTFEPAPLVDRADLELAHDPAYVRSVLDGSVDPRIMRRIGFPWSEQLVLRTRASAGGTLAAARDAMSCGFGGNLAGGTHHAFRSEVLRRDGLISRAAVVDLDVHQGDGTASIFEHDPEVLTVSIHGENNFPFRKQRSCIDIGLPDRTADDPYLEHVRKVLPEVISFRPDAVFYQAGVDALDGDRLGRLALTPAGLEQRDRMVLETVKRHALPVVVTMGGGYAEPIERTVEAHAMTYRVAAAVYGRFETIERDSSLTCNHL
jgi:acetoin utilization deacetylase AcuC-like enzyme